MKAKKTNDMSYADAVRVCKDLFKRPEEEMARALLQIGGGFFCRKIRMYAQALTQEAAAVRTALRAPGAKEVNERFHKAHESVLDYLRFGARLLDLEADASPAFVFGPGTWRITSREPGLKGWLTTHCPKVNYCMAMSAKKVAARLRAECGAGPDVPFLWLLPEEELPTAGVSAAMAATVRKGRKTMVELLKAYPTRDALYVHTRERFQVFPGNWRKDLWAFAWPDEAVRGVKTSGAWKPPRPLTQTEKAKLLERRGMLMKTLKRVMGNIMALKRPTAAEREMVTRMARLAVRNR